MCLRAGWCVRVGVLCLFIVYPCAYMHTCIHYDDVSCIMHGVNISYDFLYLHSVQGHAADSDNDGASVPCFELFLRLMKEEK